MTPLFPIFLIVCACGALGGWFVYLRFLRQHPALRQLAPSVSANSPDPVLWISSGGIRFPFAVGGLSATTPLVSYRATARGLLIRSWLLPAIDIPWAKMRRVEAVAGRAIRIFVKEPQVGIMATSLQGRDALIDVAEQHGVTVERKPQPARWWSDAGLQ